MNRVTSLFVLLLCLLGAATVMAQMSACTTDSDCGGGANAKGVCAANGYCSCKSGFGGPSCQNRPSGSCNFHDVSTLEGSLSVVPDVEFNHPNLTAIIDINLQESSLLFPELNNSLNSLPYAAETYIVFGDGSHPDCDFPNGDPDAIPWSDVAASGPSACFDRYMVQFSWSDAKTKCGFTDPDGDNIFEQTITVIRVYQMEDLRAGQPVSRNESSTHILSIQFPTEVSITSSSTSQVTGEIDVISAITRISFNPTSEEWSLSFDTSVQAPFQLEQPQVTAQTGQINNDNRYKSNSLATTVVTGCANNDQDCQQSSSLQFVQGGALVPCDPLSGTITITYHVTCSVTGSSCPLIGNETVSIQLVLATGSSCPAQDIITFSTLSLSSFADEVATTSRTGFITNQLGYFAAIVESEDGEIATRTIKPNSVCFQIGTGSCQTVDINTNYPASNGYEPIFSVDFDSVANTPVFQDLWNGPNSAQQYTVKAVVQVTFVGGTQKKRGLDNALLLAPRVEDNNGQEMDVFTQIILINNPQVGSAKTGDEANAAGSLAVLNSLILFAAASLLYYLSF